MTALVLGIDSSTQSTKVELRRVDDGAVVGQASAPHPPVSPPVAEQDPTAWWDALASAVAQLGDERPNIVAVSVAGQQHGLVLLDEHGRVIRPAKLWNDTTSAAAAATMVESLGPELWARTCGSVPVASFTVTKLAWMAANEPDTLHATRQVMLPHDYLTWRLTGQHVTDRGDASGTGWFDPASSKYSPTLLAAAGVEPEQWLGLLPTVADHREPVGVIGPDAADLLGLPTDVAVGVGTGDNMAAALGLGLEPGDIAMSLGTSGTVYAVSSTPTTDATGAVAGFADANGGYLPLVCTLNATKVTDTIAALLGTDARGLAELAAEAPDEFSGVVLVPYFDGERTPNLPNASGSIHGLRTTVSRAQLARAAYDGVLCGLFAGVDALSRAGVDTTGRLHLIGGGARSSAYQQRCADLRGADIVVPDSDESVAAGAALQAASLVDARSIGELASAWSLGSGRVVSPSGTEDGAAIRAAYAEAAAQAHAAET